MNDAPPMPVTLKCVLGFFGLGLALNLYTATSGAATTGTWIGLAISIGLIVGLARGNESVRALVRALSILGLLAGVVSGIRLVPYFGMGLDSLVLFGFFAAGLAVVGSVFTFWALGREDVALWMARRTLGSV